MDGVVSGRTGVLSDGGGGVCAAAALLLEEQPEESTDVPITAATIATRLNCVFNMRLSPAYSNLLPKRMRPPQACVLIRSE